MSLPILEAGIMFYNMYPLSSLPENWCLTLFLKLHLADFFFRYFDILHHPSTFSFSSFILYNYFSYWHFNYDHCASSKLQELLLVQFQWLQDPIFFLLAILGWHRVTSVGFLQDIVTHVKTSEERRVILRSTRGW